MIEFYLHIGMGKAASKYVQNLLYKNRFLLKEWGFCYFTENEIYHLNKIPDWHDKNFKKKLKSFLENQVAYAREEKLSKIIISAEKFFDINFRNVKCAIMDVFQQYGKLKVIVFLRRQDQFLEAAWKQWYYKDINYKNFQDFKKRFIIPNYLENIKLWDEISNSNIYVIPLNAETSKSLADIICQILGKESHCFAYLPEKVNEKHIGLNSKGIDFLFRARELLVNIHDHSHKNLVYKYLPLFVKKDMNDHGLLSLKERIEILKKHNRINQLISRKYYNAFPLFDEPVEDGSETKVCIDDLIKAFMQALHIIDNRLKYNSDFISAFEKLSKFDGVCIFGLGKSGKMTYEFIKKYYPEKIKYFIDDNVKGEYEGIPIVTTDEFLAKHQTEVDIVVFGKYQHLNPKLLPNLKIKYLRLENIV